MLPHLVNNVRKWSSQKLSKEYLALVLITYWEYLSRNIFYRHGWVRKNSWQDRLKLKFTLNSTKFSSLYKSRYFALIVIVSAPSRRPFQNQCLSFKFMTSLSWIEFREHFLSIHWILAKNFDVMSWVLLIITNSLTLIIFINRIAMISLRPLSAVVIRLIQLRRLRLRDSRLLRLKQRMKIQRYKCLW